MRVEHIADVSLSHFFGGGEEALLKLLEANHMFSGTTGASFCVDGGRVKLERLVSLATFWREGGRSILMSLFKSVCDWRSQIDSCL